MKHKIKLLLGEATGVLVKYPLTLLASVVAGLSGLLSIDHENDQTAFSLVLLAFVSALGISLFFALKMVSQGARTKSKSIALSVVALLGLVLLYFYLPSKEREFTEPFGYLLAALFVLSHLLVAFAPYLKTKGSVLFWNYNKQLFIHLFLAGVFTGILVAGVLLSLLSVDKLFELQLSESVYPKTFVLLAITGSTFIFLLFGSKGLPDLEKPTRYPSVLKFFTQLILIPLLLIYVVILYLYALKILIHWELPRGWVSYLILIYAFVGQLALLLVHPLKEEQAKSWVRIFSKAFYYTLVPLLILLFTALFTRILEYGYTEPRYFLLMLSLWLTTLVAYFLVKPKGTIKFIPISLFAFGLFALVMPYLNAFSTAKRSQKTEFLRELKGAKLLENGMINFQHPLESHTLESLSDKFRFLAERQEWSFLEEYLPQKQKLAIKKTLDKTSYWNLESRFKSSFTNVQTKKVDALNSQFTLSSRHSPIVVTGFRYAYHFRAPTESRVELDGKTLSVELAGYVNKPHFTLSLIQDDKTLDSKELYPLLLKQIQPFIGQSGIVQTDALVFPVSLGGYEVQVHILELSAHKASQKAAPWVIEPIEITLLIRKN